MTVGELREKLAPFDADIPVVISLELGHEAVNGKIGAVVGWRCDKPFLVETVKGAECVTLQHECLMLDEVGGDWDKLESLDQYLCDADRYDGITPPPPPDNPPAEDPGVDWLADAFAKK